MNSTIRAAAAAALLLSVASPLFAQSQPAPRPSLFTKTDAIWGAAFVVGSIALSTADVRIAGAINEPSFRSADRDRVARNFARFQEGSLFVGNMALWGIGRLADMPALADVGFHAAEAVFVGSLASQVIRGPLGRSRPHVTNFTDQYDFSPFKGFAEFEHRAFPSIHTASAFAAATVYTLETNRRAQGATWIVAPIAYTLAVGPALSRMYTGQHWASDVLGGAIMGIFAGTKIVRYNHDVKPDNAVNRFFLGAGNIRVGVGAGSASLIYAAAF